MAMADRSHTQKVFAEAIERELRANPLCLALIAICRVDIVISEEKQFGPYAVDILLTLNAVDGRLTRRFAIECDGPFHYDPERQRQDNTRTKYLRLNHGVLVERYHVEELDADMAHKARLAVLSAIAHYSLDDLYRLETWGEFAMLSLAMYVMADAFRAWREDRQKFAATVRRLGDVQWIPSDLLDLARRVAAEIEGKTPPTSVKIVN